MCLLSHTSAACTGSEQDSRAAKLSTCNVHMHAAAIRAATYGVLHHEGNFYRYLPSVNVVVARLQDSLSLSLSLSGDTFGAACVVVSGIEVQDAQQLRVSLGTDPVKLRDAIVAKVLQQEPASVRFVGPLGRTPPLLSIAMAAVAAARVRLQQKGAAVDVGVMPYAETLVSANARADGTDSADAGKREKGAKLGKGSSKSWGKHGAVTAKSSGQASRVVYSLRLVPLPPVSAGAEDR